MDDSASSQASFDPSVASSEAFEIFAGQDEQHPDVLSNNPMGNRMGIGASSLQRAEQNALQGEATGDQLFANNDNAEQLSEVSTELSDESNSQIIAIQDLQASINGQLEASINRPLEARINTLNQILESKNNECQTLKVNNDTLQAKVNELQNQLNTNALNNQSVTSTTEEICFLKRHPKTTIVTALIIFVLFSLLVYNTSISAGATTGTCHSAEPVYFNNANVENVRASRTDIHCVFGIMPCVCIDSFCVQATATVYSYLTSIEPWATFVGVRDLTFTLTNEMASAEMQQIFEKIQCSNDIGINGRHWHCNKTVPASVLFHY